MSEKAPIPKLNPFDRLRQKVDAKPDLSEEEGSQLHRGIVEAAFASPLVPTSDNGMFTLDDIRCDKIPQAHVLTFDFSVAKQSGEAQVIRICVPIGNGDDNIDYNEDFQISTIQRGTDGKITRNDTFFLNPSEDPREMYKSLIKSAQNLTQKGVGAIGEDALKALNSEQIQETIAKADPKIAAFVNNDRLKQIPNVEQTFAPSWTQLRREYDTNLANENIIREQQADKLGAVVRENTEWNGKAVPQLFQLIDNDPPTSSSRRLVRIPKIGVSSSGKRMNIHIVQAEVDDGKPTENMHEVLLTGRKEGDKTIWHTFMKNNQQEWIDIDRLLGGRTEIGNKIYVANPTEVRSNIKQFSDNARTALQEIVLGIAESGISLKHTSFEHSSIDLSNVADRNVFAMLQELLPQRFEELRTQMDQHMREYLLFKENQQKNDEYKANLRALVGGGMFAALDRRLTPLQFIRPGRHRIVIDATGEYIRSRGSITHEQSKRPYAAEGVYRSDDGGNIIVRPKTEIELVEPSLLPETKTISAIVGSLSVTTDYNGRLINEVYTHAAEDPDRSVEEGLEIKKQYPIPVTTRLDITETDGSRYTIYPVMLSNKGVQVKGIIMEKPGVTPVCYFQGDPIYDRQESKGIL